MKQLDGIDVREVVEAGPRALAEAPGTTAHARPGAGGALARARPDCARLRRALHRAARPAPAARHLAGARRRPGRRRARGDAARPPAGRRDRAGCADPALSRRVRAGERRRHAPVVGPPRPRRGGRAPAAGAAQLPRRARPRAARSPGRADRDRRGARPAALPAVVRQHPARPRRPLARASLRPPARRRRRERVRAGRRLRPRDLADRAPPEVATLHVQPLEELGDPGEIVAEGERLLEFAAPASASRAVRFARLQS